MKKFLLLIFTFLSFNSIFSQTTCTDTSPICSGNISPRPSLVGPNLGSPGCLGSAPNGNWYTFQTGFAGDLVFNLHQGNNAPLFNNLDIDYICWGPFTNAQMQSGTACNNLYDMPSTAIPNNIVGCSYSASPTETITIPNANPGSNYILLITNFSNQAGQFVMEQTNASLPGAGSTNCDVVCGVDLGDTATAIFLNTPSPINTVNLCTGTASTYTLYAIFQNPPANQATLSYQWYLGNVLQPAYTTQSITVSQSGTWKVRVTHPDCGFPTEDSVIIKFGETPVLNQPPTQVGALGDCNPTFNLTSLIPALLAPSNPADFTVYFFTDYVDALVFDGVTPTGSIANPSAFQPSPAVDTVIYVRAVNNSANCLDDPTPDVMSFLLDVQCVNSATAVGNTICVGSFGQLTFTGTPNAVVTFTEGSNTYNVTLNASGTFVWTTPLPLITTTTYTLTNVAAGSPVVNTPLSSTATITVIPQPVVTSFTGTTSICLGSSTNLTFVGTPNATVTYTDGTTTQPGVLLDAAGNGSVTVSPTTTTTYSLVSIATTGTPGCTNPAAGTVVVTVTNAPTATITYASPFCSNNAIPQAVTFSGTSGAYTGGTFSSTTGLTINATTGAIIPSTSTAGTYIVVYTIPASGGCPAVPVNTIVTITALPAATIAYTGTPFCTSNATPQPVTLTGTTGGTYSSTAGLTIDSATGAITPSISTAGTYTVTYTMAAAFGCPMQTATTTVTITLAPTAAISYASPFCSNNAIPQTVTFSGTSGAYTGGTFSSTTGLTINATTGAITPSTSTAGTYIVVYTIPASGGCPAVPVNTIVTITALPAATIAYTGTPFCASNATPQPVTLTGTTGGTYSSTAGLTIDSATGAITPSISTAGTYTVTYTMAAAFGCPMQTATTTVTITLAPTAVITYATPFCSNNATPQAVTFSGTTGAYTGGTFSSTTGLTINATTGAITPSTSTAGTYTVTYTIPSSAGCAAVPVTTSVTITALPAATIAYVGTPFCTSNATPQAVTLTGTTGGTFTSTTGLTINATTGAITASTSTAGTYTVTYTMAAANGCPLQTATTTVTITLAPTATITYATPFCSNNATPQAVTFSGTAGAYTGGTFASTTGLTINATTGAITPSTSTAGTYTVTYTIPASGGCAAIPVTTSVTITALPAATIAYVGTPFCTSNATPQTVTLTGTTGGTFSSTTGLSINATTGAITASTSTAGTYTVTYTMAAANGCPLQTATTTVTITAAPTATITYASPFCVNNPTLQTVAFSGTSGAYTGGTFTSTTGLTINATTGAITPNTSTAGTYTVTYTIPASGGCAAIPVTTSVTISPIPTNISITGTTTICAGGSANLTVTATPGTVITWSGTPSSFTIGASGSNVIPVSPAVNTTYNLTSASLNGCTIVVSGQSATVSVSATPQFITQIPDITICNGGTLNIASQLTSTVPGATYIWSATTGNVNMAAISGDETNIDQLVTLINNLQNGTVNIEVKPQIGSCSGASQQILVTVKPIPVITSTVADKTVICNNEFVTLTSNSNPVATVYNWQVNTATGVQIVGGATSGTSTTGIVNLQLTLTNPLVAGTISFDFTPQNGICTGATVANAVTITVNPIPGTPIGLPVDEICSGETTNLTISSFPNIAGTTLEWTVIDSQNVTGFANGTGTAPFTINDVLINTSNVQGYVVYSVTSKLGNCEGGTTEYTVLVNPLPLPNLLDGHICVNQTTGVTYQSYILDAQLSNPDFTYDWYVLNTTTGLYDALPSSNQSTFEVTVPGTYQVIVTNTVTLCQSVPVQATVITVYPATAFTTVVTDAFTNNATITVTVNPIGTGNLIYSLDGGAWQSSNVFTGVEAGIHQVMVEDLEGCTNLTETVEVIDYPKFFTPNGDGFNDNWKIVGLEAKHNAKIYIFDRYGKLIKQIDPLGEGWDGRYNGQDIPSTDYWFSVDYTENEQQKQFKAHFSLKR